MLWPPPLGAKGVNPHAYGIEEMACVRVCLACGAGASSRRRRGGMREHEDGHENGDEHRHEDRDFFFFRRQSSRPELYGHVKSLTRKGTRYEMRFDPAWVLNGVAAEHAAVEDGAIAQGELGSERRLPCR